VDATTDERMDEVSSQGYAWGYIGSCVPFIACLPSCSDALGHGPAPRHADLLRHHGGLVGRLHRAHARNVEQTHYKPRESHACPRRSPAWRKTIPASGETSQCATYIIAYFFYIDGVHTIIKLATSYGTDLGIDGTQLVLALLVTQFVAFPSPSSTASSAARWARRR
jgi:UMF1 family MFS transporter